MDNGTKHDLDEQIWGAKPIGEAIGKKERQAFYLLERGLIPGAFKCGRQWTITRRNLNRFKHGEAV